jgi:hypothetical protein
MTVLRGDESEATEDISVREARACATEWPEIFGGTRQHNKGGNGPAQEIQEPKDIWDMITAKVPTTFKGVSNNSISK